MAILSLTVLGPLTLICLVLVWAFSRENTRVPNDSWTRTLQTRQTSGWLWGGSTVAGIDPGFITRQTMTVPLDIHVPPYTETSALAFYRTLETRILQIPGVQSLAYGSLQPFRQVPPSEVRLSNQVMGHGRPASVDDVSADFFSTFGIPLIHGRSFQPSDLSTTASTPVAIVSTAFAKTFWGGDDPLGKTIVTPDDKRFVVVGVARDTRSEHFGVLDGPRLYTLRDPHSLNGQLFVRFNGDTASVTASIQEIVRSLDPNQVDTPQTFGNPLKPTLNNCVL